MFKENVLSQDGQLAIIRKFTGSEEVDPRIDAWLEANSDRVGTGCIIDTETTGLDKSDEVIEIALRLFKYDRDTLRIARTTDCYNALNQPSKEISEEITKITGLTNSDLEGQRIDWDKVDQLLKQSDFIVAHNASFDRPMVEKYSKVSSSKLWCCSVEQIDWQGHGFPSKKQEILCVCHGFFYDAHRAQIDVDALAKLISHKDAGYLSEILQNAKKDYGLVKACRSDFESKDKLKARGFKWDGPNKYWYNKVQLSEVGELKDWLKENAYQNQPSNFKFLEVCEIKAIDNFK